MAPKTLLQLAGATVAPPSLRAASVLVIDAQREYLDGALPLAGVERALDEIATLLTMARRAGAAIVHVKHRGRAGGAFDPDAPRGAILPQAAPLDGEAVIEKTLPNAFAGTDCRAVLEKLGRRDLVVAGFMTHMCVEATARAALDLGFNSAIVAAATATRDLPDALGGAPLAAADVQRNALAALADRFAVIVPGAGDLPA